jgi:hypothetical protein
MELCSGALKLESQRSNLLSPARMQSCPSSMIWARTALPRVNFRPEATSGAHLSSVLAGRFFSKARTFIIRNAGLGTLDPGYYASIFCTVGHSWFTGFKVRTALVGVWFPMQSNGETFPLTRLTVRVPKCYKDGKH